MFMFRESEASDEEKRVARERLEAFLPNLFLAANAAALQEAGTVMLSVTLIRADGSGKITASFEAVDFLNDLDTLFGPST